MISAYIGTYTKKTSKGIYRIDIDLKNNSYQILEAANVENPTYLALSKGKNHLYSVAKIDNTGAVASFFINNDNSLTPLTYITKEGKPPCYLEVSKDNKFLISANYHTATIDSYSINKDGSLDTLISSSQHTGNGPHERQEKAHAHFSGFSPDGKFLLTCDLGTDSITTYELINGTLQQKYNFTVKSGSGPRHLVFTSTLDKVFVMTELTSEIISFDYNSSTGELTNSIYYPTLSHDFNLENKGSAIRISNDNNYIYVSNRGLDAIVIFKFENNKLNYINSVSTFGEGPRDFNISNNGDLAIATNENTDNITIYKVNKEDGSLAVLFSDIKIPEPVSILFLN